MSGSEKNESEEEFHGLKDYSYEEFQRYAIEFNQFMEAKLNGNWDALYDRAKRIESDFELLDISLNPQREIAWRTLCWCMTSVLYRLFGNQRPSALRRWLLAMIFFGVSSYIMCLANVLTEYRRKEMMEVSQNDIQNKTHKYAEGLLPDLGFDFADHFTPWLTQFASYPDIAQMILTGIAMIWLIFDCEKRLAALILRRVLIIQGLLCLSRAICLLGTQLPNPYDSYPDQDWCKDHTIFVEALFVLFRIKVTTTDVFFSGHTVFLVSIALTIEYYIKPGIIRHIFAIIIWLAVLFSLYMIVAVKFHYTIDVIIAGVLTLMVWKIYHMALEYPQLKDAFPVLYFLEGDTKVNPDSSYTKKVWARQLTTNAILSPRESEDLKTKHCDNEIVPKATTSPKSKSKVKQTFKSE